LTRSIQTALSGSAARSIETAFLSAQSDGTNTENMETPQNGTGPPNRSSRDFGKGFLIARRTANRLCGGQMARIPAFGTALLKIQPEPREHEAKKTQLASRSAGQASKLWNQCSF
jgi:hypothetical protein